MFNEIDNEELEVMMENGAIAFDIRRQGEFQATGIIENSIALTFFDDRGEHDIDKWMGEFQKHVKSKDQEVILICAHANRTKSVGTFLSNQMSYTKVYDLAGGIASWIQEGNETVKLK